MTISQNNSLTDFQIFKITFSQNHRIALLLKGYGKTLLSLIRMFLNYIKVKIFLFFQIFISIIVVKVGVAD